MEQVPQNILLLRGNHEEEFLCYLELLLAVQEKRQLVIEESSSKDLEHLYQETKNLIEQHNSADRANPGVRSLWDAGGADHRTVYFHGRSAAVGSRDGSNAVFLQIFPAGEGMCCGTCRIPEQFPTAGLTGKYTCAEDFYLRAREDAYLTGESKTG